MPAPDPLVRPAEPRQRWRAVIRRPAEPTPDQRAFLAAVAAAFESAGAGVATSKGRPAIALGAAMPANVAGEAELLDVTLTDRITLAAARAALTAALAALPPGAALLDVHDVWVGAPTLGATVVAAEWRVALAGPLDVPARAALEAACAHLLAAPSLPRTRAKGGADVAYDLRPLLLDVRAGAVPGPGPGGVVAALHLRTAIDPERGSGKPDEVVAALREASGLPLEAASVTRVRLLVTGG